MKKFWALIGARRPHIFALGKVKDDNEAVAKAEDFCNRKNEENKQIAKERNLKIEDFVEFVLLAVLTENDLRGLIGEVHRPLVISSAKPTVAVEGPKKHGAHGLGGKAEAEAEDTTLQREESDSEG
jgi:hypothetical protein